MKKHVLITTLLLGIAISFVKAVPLNGTYFIDNTALTGGSNFNNFTDAVTALNTDGVSGPVVFNVTAGQVWALTCAASPNNYGLKITATGTATNTITFQKSGLGSNPLLNITGTSVATDMGIWLSGASYITFDGIDMTDAGTTTTNFLDYGFYLKASSTTVGCKSNVYQNGTITLHRTNATAYGVFVDGAGNTAGTAQNKYNKFYNNTIINAFQGYRLNGYSSTAINYRDLGTEIGTINGGRSQVLATGSATVATLSYGIFAQNQDSISIFNTLVDSVQTSNTGFPGATGIYCINISTAKIYGDTMRNIIGPVQAVGLNFENENGENIVYGNLIENVVVTSATSGSNNVMRLYGAGALGTIIKLSVYNNTVRNCGATLSASPVEGMYFGSLSATTTVYCYNNTVTGLYNSRTTNHTGTIDGIFVNSSTTFYVYNNIVSDITNAYCTAAPAIRAISISSLSGMANIYNNTVYLDANNVQAPANTTFASACLYSGTATNMVNVRNNIFVNKNAVTLGLRAVASWWTGVSYTTLQATSNNNLYYAGTPSAKNLLFYDGTNSIQTLGAYKTLLANKDLGAYTEDVPFVNGTTLPFDLHVNMGIATQAESGAGSILPLLTTDCENNLRNTTTPDLGAYEFVGILLDLSPPLITYTPLVNTNIVGTRTLKVCIKDLSGVPTSGAGLPVLYYNINAGVYTGVTGTYISNDTFSFAFGATAVPGNTVGYYIVAQDNVGVPNVGSSPANWNGSFVSNPPTAGAAPVSVSSYILLGTIPAGTYLVGVGNTYPTLTAAMNAYNLMGLGGPIVFELTDATYPSETYPITIGNNLTADATNTLTIRPVSTIASTITFSASSATAIFDLNGAKYVTIDGRPGGAVNALNLAVQNTSTAGNTILLRNEASNNKLTYLDVSSANTVAATLTAIVATGTMPGAIVIGNTTGSNGNDFNTIAYCDIHSTGTTLGAGIYAGNNTPTGSAPNNDSNIIVNNNIYDYFIAASASAGIDIGLGNNKFVINNNKLYQTTARTYSGTPTHRAIMVGPYTSSVPTAGSGFVIHNNTIGYSSAAGTGLYTIGGTTAWLWFGIDLTMGLGAATSVQGNIITEMSVVSTGNGGSAAMVGYQVNNGNVDLGTVSGNMMGSTTSNTSILFNATTTNSGVMGIRTGAGGTINLANNIISGITLTGSTTSVVPIFNGITASGGITVNILNNTIGSGTLVNSIYLPTAATAITVQSVRGIIVNGAATLSSTVSGNLIANLTTNIIATGTQANAVLGIAIANGASTVANNTIRNLVSSTRTTGAGASSAVQGILYTSITAPAVIEGNKMYNFTSLAPTTAAQVVGITYSGPTTGVNKIAGNQIYSNTMVSTAPTAALLGIVVNSGVTSVYNNAIALGNDSMDFSMNNPLDIRGITEAGGTNTFYFNTVSITGTAATNTTSTYAFYSNLTTGTRIYKNNVFSNKRSFDVAPTTTGNYAALIGGTVAAGAIAGLTSNYNLYFANGLGGAVILNGLTGTAYSTLSSWTAVAPTHDFSSVTGNPNFISNELLRGLSGTAMVNGDATTGVTTDITGITRVNNLMGAYDVYFTVPVTLYSFTAKAEGSNILLNWATASEINNDHFNVERSFDRSNWETIATVKGAGTTNKPSLYNITDKKADHTGYVYYRLKQVDHDGTADYSKTVAVWIGETTANVVRMYPNPVNASFTVEALGNNLTGATVSIIDLVGKTVYTSVIENEQSVITIESLASGTYILQVTAGNETSRMKFLKQ
jgi:hypothetical protein